MQFLIFPFLLLALVIGSAWPLFFRKWKYWQYLLIPSTILVVALGAVSMVYYQLERNYVVRGEANAVELTRRYLDAGGDPGELGRRLDVWMAQESYRSEALRNLVRQWSRQVLALMPPEVKP